MPEIGFAELLVVGLILVVVVGPERLPEVFAQAARAWREVRRWILELRRAWREEVETIAEPLAETRETLRGELDDGRRALEETADEARDATRGRDGHD